jgi:hypothetical protein
LQHLLQAHLAIGRCAKGWNYVRVVLLPGPVVFCSLHWLTSWLLDRPGAAPQVLEGVVTDKFILNWLDLLSFLLSGLPANGTIAAEVAFMFNEWYRPDCMLDWPVGGSQAMVQALIRCVVKTTNCYLLF